MKVIILTEGSNLIGLGHITRCISIYQAFALKEIMPTLIVNGDETIVDLLLDKRFEIFDWATCKDQLIRKIKNADVVVIDSYLAPVSLYERISDVVHLCVCIDDNLRIKYPKGIVINGTIYSEEFNYPEDSAITYLLGSQYIPLRQAFWEVPAKTVNEVIGSVIITFGGHDTTNLTPRVLAELTKEFPTLKKRVVVGMGYRNLDDIIGASDINTELFHNPCAESMRDIMLNSDLAISAAGQTLYELARTGTPTIAIEVADNQRNNVKGWSKAGFIEFAGHSNHRELCENTSHLLSRLKNVHVREEKNHCGRSLVDGQGAKRIVQRVGRIL